MLKTSSKSCDGMTTMLPAVLLYMCPAHFNVHALMHAGWHLGPNKRMCAHSVQISGLTSAKSG